MNIEYFNIKDKCRKGLLKYLSKAISIIPAIENPSILDIGCGSGVPTLFLAEKFNGNITAIDNDAKLINRLEAEAKELNLSKRITLLNSSLFDTDIEENQFDLIVSEGFLNVVGFQRGFLKIIKLLKRNKFLIIHDEFRSHIKKTELIESNNCKILDLFELDEQVWWNDYFKCLEKEIFSHGNKELFKTDLKEIELFKKNPSQFKSVYFVIKKNSFL